MPLLDRTAEAIRAVVAEAAGRLGWTVDPAAVGVERPRDPAHGDFAVTLALALAGELKRNPREIADRLRASLEAGSPPGSELPIAALEVAGPGFLNLHLQPVWLEDGLREVLAGGDAYGRSRSLAGREILFEFISANPTGPLNVVSARAAAVGDALAALWAAAGARVGREYYVNDTGRQVRLLGESLAVRLRQEAGETVELPAEGYHGDYLVELAREFAAAYPGGPETFAAAAGSADTVDALATWAVERILERQMRSVEAFGVRFDTWFHESSLHQSGAVDGARDALQAEGYTYEADGALWLRSTDFGDEKDRVLVTGDGRPTYLLPDIAYHRDKYARGWRILVDLWGPDHHGYIPRLSAALQALGHEPDSFRVLVVQQVNLLRAGEPVKMSKRAGRLIEMEELIEEVGVDAARFFFLMRATGTHLDFDLDLAAARNEENPVFYVQYAHARIASLLRKACDDGIDLTAAIAGAELARLHQPEERALLRLLVEFPVVVAEAAGSFEPHRLPAYLRDLAAAFHPFYHNHRVVGSDEPEQNARLALCLGVRQVLANGLGLLGVTAPERM